MPSLHDPPPPLPFETTAGYKAAAASWPGGAYDVNTYTTAAKALDAYAAFHAHALAQPRWDVTHQSLVFVPNQYGLGNRLRAMKSALLVAMLTGRIFHVRWEEPFQLEALVQPEKIDWRLPKEPELPRADANKLPPEGLGLPVEILCLPFATAPRGGLCGEGQNLLMRGDLKGRYGTTRVLEVHTFTDLNIYLATNPHYEKILKRLGETCPKRMGCLYKYLFSPAPVLQHELDMLVRVHTRSHHTHRNAPLSQMRVVVVALLLQLPRPPAHLTKGIQHQGVHIGVQVRNRLWTLERHKHPEQTKWGKSMADQAKRIIDCMDLYVPPIYKVREECMRPAAA